jgi:hypothetical protein
LYSRDDDDRCDSSRRGRGKRRARRWRAREAHCAFARISGFCRTEFLDRIGHTETNGEWIFPNAASCRRLTRALCAETHESWLEDNRYINIDLLRGLQNGRPVLISGQRGPGGHIIRGVQDFALFLARCRAGRLARPTEECPAHDPA